MSKVKAKTPAVTPDEVFLELRSRLGSRIQVARAMGTNRTNIYRWETGIHPIPGWAFILISLLGEKYPAGLPGPGEPESDPEGAVEEELDRLGPAGPAPVDTRSLHPSGF